MKKFKYKIAYKCDSKEEFEEVKFKLEQIGYSYASPLAYSQSNSHILTHWSNTSNEFSNSSDTHGDRELIKEVDCFLVLASMRDSDEFFEGEYIYYKWNLDNKKILKIKDISDGFISTDEHFNHFTIRKSPFKDNTHEIRKATKEEIVNYFNSQKKEVKEEKQMEKKIIGYKLIKPEYTDAVLNIEGHLTIGFSIKNGEQLVNKEEAIDKLNNAGVLDLWFEPVYEELVVGKWYVVSTQHNQPALVNFQGTHKKAFGINHAENWTNCYGSLSLWNQKGEFTKTIIRLATEEEIKSALVKEAIKRGFKEGIKHTCIKNYPDKKDKGYPFRKSLTYSIESDSLYSSAAYIYYQGKWAEIIPSYYVGDWVLLSMDGCNGLNKDSVVQLMRIDESKEPTGELKKNADFMFKAPKYSMWKDTYLRTKASSIIRLATAEEIKQASYPDITINGYKAEFFDTYVKFGCAEFSKHFIHELYESLVGLNESAEALANTNRTINSIKLGIGEFTLGQIKEIKDYYSK